MDVLFLSVAAGGGHGRAAEAIKERVESRFPGSRTMILDTLKYVNPIIDKLIIGGYLNAVKNTPQIYGKLYSMSESGENLNDLSRTVNKILSFKIKKLINNFKPSVIVCTHFFPLMMVSNLKKKQKIGDIPTVAILTDFVAHPIWLHDHTDAYVVSHKYMKQEMVDRGINPDIIYPFGIPVCSEFLQSRDRKVILEEMGLEDKPTILIMGGSLGFGEVKNTFLALLNIKKDLQIIAVTGKNQKLKHQLERYTSNTDKNVKIFSYTNQISDLMSISDFLITKPGGMTISEALIKGLPIFIISPIPGQEERNAHYLINNGAAVRLLENDNVDSVLNQIIDNPIRIRQMKEMAKYLARPDSADKIAELLDTLVNK